MPRLQTKTLTRQDKKRARALELDTLRALAIELACPPADALADDPSLRDSLALATYGHDLLRRLDGVSQGPASLALWRRFAWTPEGSPRPRFALTASAILGKDSR